MNHPQVGELTVSCEKLTISGTDGQMLVVYHAESGTDSADKLALLSSLATPNADAANNVSTRLPSGRSDSRAES